MSSRNRIKGTFHTKPVGNGHGLSPVPHARGSIVRIKLHNFLTFDGVEIWPTSQLNVIVGPNGTGKSSVVCAICIGLGGATKLLGRAKEIREFVKHGKREGFVEIELCETKGGAKNPVVKRKISADDNSSLWFINGVVAKQADVTKLVENLNIQLQNKCVFLPQDMVVEFARMNMHQRLEETELAVGSKKMFVAHTELKSLRSSFSDEQTQLSAQKKTLKDEERKNQLLERDVERFQNRQRYEDEIKWIGLKKLWLEYEAARSDMNDKKAQRKDASMRVKQLRQTYQPIKEKHKTQEDALKKFKESEKGVSIKRRRTLRTVTELQEKLTALGDKLDEPRQELEQSKNDEAERKHKIEKLQREIEGFRQELEALEPHESIAHKIQAKNAQMAKLKQEIDDITYQLREMAEERKRYNDTIRHNEDELTRMQDVRSQRLQMLERSDPWAYKALRWLESNQHLFRKPILEPVMVSVNIVDQRFTSQVEAFLGGRDFVSFVAQTEEDRELFLREVRDKMKLKVNAVRAPSKCLRDYKPEIPVQTLRKYGFEKVMMELIQAPEPLLCYFCEYQHLHQVPIAGELPPAQIQTITNKLPNLRLFFAGSSRYSVTRSKYRNATSTRVGQVRAPRFLINSVDMQKKTALEQEIQAVVQCRSELDGNYEALKRQDEELRKNITKLQQEKNALKKVSDQRRAHTGNIASRETRLQSLTTVTFDLQEAEERCQIAVDKIHKERVKCFATIERTLKSAVSLTTEFVEASLRVKTSEMRVNYLLQQYHSMKDSFEKAERDLARLEEGEKQAKEKAQLLLQRARAKSGVDSPADNQEVLDHFQGLPNTLDELLELMHDLQAKADMCEGIDPAVVHEYDDRKKQIENMRQKIEEKEKFLQNREDRISKLKEEWLGPLKELVSGISDRFRLFFSNHTHMEAAGEVCLVESDDFNKYGIEIKVKFRDNEQLQALNAQRQSGGERSVSTMLYLMALQGGSRCPFRVVDEINQGMDPVNERHVFNLIVKSAAEGAQYFLLTPKLLQNLEYSEAVQVHVVNNGQEALDFSEYDLRKILA